MSAKRTLFSVLLAFASFVVTLSANSSELALRKPQNCNLTAGTTQSFFVSLGRGDFAQIKLDPHGAELVVMSFDASGNKARGAILGPEKDEFNFVANRPGTYRVEVAAKDKRIEETCTITLEKVVTLAARVTPPTPAYESPRIKALRASVASGKPSSVGAFWEDVKKQGAPLIEPLPGDDDNMLVTFLWRGTPDTHNVLVLRFPYAAGRPDDYYMTHLGQTDVWYKTVKVGKRARFDYTLAPNVPRPFGVPQGLDGNDWAMIMAASRPDPLNPKCWRIDQKSVDAPEYRGNSVVEMPDAPAQPWLSERAGVPRGQLLKQRFKSTLLKNEREIAVYLPPGYSSAEPPYPLLVLFDERAYLGDKEQILLVPTPTILDNLIAEKRIPPVVAILVGNVAGARSSELACNPVFMDFLLTELLPWADGLYNFTTNPRQTVIGGSSLGGLTATCAGLRNPERFGNILSQSGSFWWRPQNEQDSEPDWIAKQFIASPRLPLRFYLDAGSDELDLSGSGSSILLTTRSLRDVLLAKGYEVHYQEFAGGHDFLSWRSTLADGLIALMGNDSTKRAPEAGAKP